MDTTKTKIITIAGRPGSGKSTAAKAVAEKLGYLHFSSGDLFRALAKEQGIDVLQANEDAENEKEIPKIDELVDGRLQEIGKNDEEVVIDSRLAWHWMPRSYKVFLDLSLDEAATRILSKLNKDRMAAENIPLSAHEYAKTLQKRLDSETRRYKKVYGINPYDISNYDLVINTATHDANEVTDLILTGYADYLD